jgi:DNA-binding transcriptional MerR regulator
MLAAQPRIKSPEAFRTISEVSGDLDVPQHVLRFWEGRFTQIRPVKRAGGRRYYRPEDIALLSRIRQCLYQEGYTIRGVQKLLADGTLGVLSGAQELAPSLFPLDPVPAAARPARVSRRTATRAEAPQPEPIVIAEPQPVGLSPGGKAALEAAAQELLSARQLLEALLQSRRRD